MAAKSAGGDEKLLYLVLCAAPERFSSRKIYIESRNYLMIIIMISLSVATCYTMVVVRSAL